MDHIVEVEVGQTDCSDYQRNNIRIESPQLPQNTSLGHWSLFRLCRYDLSFAKKDISYTEVIYIRRRKNQTKKSANYSHTRGNVSNGLEIHTEKLRRLAD